MAFMASGVTSAHTGSFSEGRYHAEERFPTERRERNYETLSDLDGSESTHTSRKPETQKASSMGFSELLDNLKVGAVFTGFTMLAAYRDRILDSESQSNLAIKGVVWLAAEIGFVAMIPLAVIEAIFRCTLSWLAYPFAALGVISNKQHDVYYGMSITYPVAAAVALGSVHAAIVNLNPRRSIENELNDGIKYCPILNMLQSN